MAIEIKKGTSFTLSRGLHEACENIKPDELFVIYAGKDKFPLRHGIVAMTLYDFMEILKEKK